MSNNVRFHLCPDLSKENVKWNCILVVANVLSSCDVFTDPPLIIIFLTILQWSVKKLYLTVLSI